MAVRAAMVAVIALLGLGVTPPIALAAGPDVGAPAATVRFLDGITFRGLATMTPDVKRVEIVIDAEGSTRSIVADVQASGTGSVSLSYVLATPSGSLLPNTDVTARFRLTLKDGSTIVGQPTTVHYEDTRFAWKAFRGTFVTVHYTDGGSSFGQRAAKIADDAVGRVSTLLGVAENDPIDFYIYADVTSFYDILGPATRESVGGEAHPEIRTLFAQIAGNALNDPWVGIVIPHELTHLVFNSATRNPYHFAPLWLNEGIATYLSEGYGSGRRDAVRTAVADGSLLPLRALTGQFPTTQDRAYLAYSVSVSAVSYLVAHYGRDAMVALVTSYGRGVSDDEAFQAALGTDVAGFEAAWLASIGAALPSPFGPQSAPAGPVPPGWGAAAPTPGPGSIETGASSPTPRPSASGQVSSGPGITGALVMLGLTVAALVAIVVLAGRQGRRRREAAMADGVPRGNVAPGDDEVMTEGMEPAVVAVADPGHAEPPLTHASEPPPADDEAEP